MWYSLPKIRICIRGLTLFVELYVSDLRKPFSILHHVHISTTYFLLFFCPLFCTICTLISSMHWWFFALWLSQFNNILLYMILLKLCCEIYNATIYIKKTFTLYVKWTNSNCSATKGNYTFITFINLITISQIYQV